MIHACNTMRVVAHCVLWLFLSHVNLHVMSCVNISFHGKFWHSTCEKLRGAMRGMSRTCEAVVEWYCMLHIVAVWMAGQILRPGFYPERWMMW